MSVADKWVTIGPSYIPWFPDLDTLSKEDLRRACDSLGMYGRYFPDESSMKDAIRDRLRRPFELSMDMLRPPGPGRVVEKRNRFDAVLGGGII